MASTHMDALSAHVISVFDSLVPGIHDQTAVITVYSSILKTVTHALRARLTAWNEKHARLRLPPEVLVSSFYYLSFTDRISVSHVSRSWRAAAVGFPGLWAKINLPPIRHAREFLKMAITRAAHLPVNFTFVSKYSSPGLGVVLREHLHQFRSISWEVDNIDEDVFASPAPLLERLSLAAPISISKGFLGGSFGRLRDLDLFHINIADDAPALPTVAILSFWVPRTGTLPVRLFSVFPRLQSLTICNLCAGTVGSLPNGPVPLSLAELHLEAGEPEGDARDAVGVYVALKTENLCRVTISAQVLDDISAFVLDARHLSVDVIHDKEKTDLIAVDARGHSRKLLLHPHPLTRELLDSIVAGSRALERLEPLQMSLPEFARLLERAPLMEEHQRPRFPALKQLTLRIREWKWSHYYADAIQTHSQRLFGWHDLEALRHLPLVDFKLQSFGLEILGFDGAELPMRGDALELLNRLPCAVEVGVSLVRIQGFPEAAVRDINLDSVPGLHIVFEAM